MAINALSYLGVHSDKLEDWKDFSCKLLGMQSIDQGNKNLSFRMDNQKQRFTVSGEPGDTVAFIGWEVENKSDLERERYQHPRIVLFVPYQKGLVRVGGPIRGSVGNRWRELLRQSKKFV